MLRSLEKGLLNESYNKLFAKSSKEALEILWREDVHCNRDRYEWVCVLAAVCSRTGETVGLLSPYVDGQIEYFRSGHHTDLGRAKFDNFDVEGFEITDPNRLIPFPKSARSSFPVTDIVAQI